jgi:hypothetical protein
MLITDSGNWTLLIANVYGRYRKIKIDEFELVAHDGFTA